MLTLSLQVVPGSRSQQIIGSIPASSLAQRTAQTGPIHIIPDEDPDRPVHDGAHENDMDNDVDVDGIGNEDDEADANEDDDSGDEDNIPTPRPLPAWLMHPFRAHVDASQSKFRDAKGLPPLYSEDAQLSFHRPSTLFLLNHPELSPEVLFNPKFVLWDPLAFCNKIPCPNCGKALQRHNVLPRPRRVVDLDGSIWLIGYRYRCRDCVHPISGKNTVTFRSWDPRLLAVLPMAVAAEFPARLTHRSGK